MGGNSCPQCRGELVDDSTENKWYITLDTPSSVASGLDPDEFEIDVVVSGQSNHQQSLPSNSGTAQGDRVVYEWSITRPGVAVSGVLTMEHSSLGTLDQVLTIS